MKRLWLAMMISAVGGTACVDPTSLSGFECDESGRCKPPASSGTGAGTGTGGGTTTGGGNASGGGGGNLGGGGGANGGGSGGGGGQPCTPSSCTGCCDDSGTCRNGDELGACGQSGLTCALCGNGTRCAAGVCQPLAANGSTCGVAADCSSAFCVSGLCCNSACTGSCETCSATGSEGRCSPLAEAVAPTACGDYACDGVSGSCPTTCTTSRQCAAGRFCNNGSCVPLKVIGTTCGSSSECSSGFCADGVCCNQACSGSCDRCNLTASNGTCTPAPAADPGSPACGGLIVCNGTLADCPILCTSGCPANTFCSGTYCSAKKPNGITCGAAPECQSNFCVDGVCCTSACADTCDACSVAQGAAVNGTCGLLGPSRICRAATSTCDAEERCNGTVATCPANASTDAGVGCGTTTFTAWSSCDGGAACASAGGQTRTRSDQLCNGTGTCAGVNSAEAQACVRNPEGMSCGTTTYSAYGTCSYASSCSTSGSRTRTRTDPLCASGACSAVQNTETDTAGCTRATDNISCGVATYGAYGSCSYGSTCAESGSRTRTRTDPACQASSCGSTTATETDTTGCTRTTGGQSCGTTMMGSYGACSYGSTCAITGTRSRMVSTYTCGSGACNTSTVTENDTAGCGRSTTGTSCSATQYGSYTACSYSGPCANTGSRTRQVTAYACNATGGCDPTTTTDTDTVGCNRSQDGSSCSPTTYGAYTACSYGSTCALGGSRTRPMTTYTCGGGSCVPASGTDTDTASCARVTDGVVCVAPVCGAPYSGSCSPDCERMMTCNQSTCVAGNCTAQSFQDFCNQGTTPKCCLGCFPM